jgi:hypothetical protein
MLASRRLALPLIGAYALSCNPRAPAPRGAEPAISAPSELDGGAMEIARALEERAPARDTEFEGQVLVIDDRTKTSMHASWHDGCPVPVEDLRLLLLSYWGFDGRKHQGRLVVHRDAAQPVLGVFQRLFTARYPIERMELIDRYEGDDDRSMSANNTSAFNCREVAGRPGVWSQHAYGRAIDMNPLQNPQVTGSQVSPPEGRRYVDRSLSDLGVVHGGDEAVRAFASIGWRWGGDWKSSKDFQHFSANGR